MDAIFQTPFSSEFSWMKMHWGSSHEGSDRHPRQHGGGRGRRLGKFTAILIVSVRYCSPSFVSWLSMLWDTLTRNLELQWFGISPPFRVKVSRGDEGVGHVCFPGDEGVGRPWRGYRSVQMNVGPAYNLELLLNLVLLILFWIQNPI